MIGADPKFRTRDRARRVKSPGVFAYANGRSLPSRSQRWRYVVLACVFVPLSFVLAQCGRAPSPGTLAANVQTSNTQAASGDTFDDRFPAPQFRDRFPSANASRAQRHISDFAPTRSAASEPAPYRVASLGPQIPYQRPTAQQDMPTLVTIKSPPFPYTPHIPPPHPPFPNTPNAQPP